MMNMGGKPGEACPFEFNFDPTTFKIGDTVSYRVPRLDGFPFVAIIKAVHEDHIEIEDPGEPASSCARRAKAARSFPTKRPASKAFSVDVRAGR